MTIAEPIERRERPLVASPPPPAPRRPDRRPPTGPTARLVGAGCLVGIAVTHAFDTADHLESAPYLGVLFILLIAKPLALAALLATNRRVELAWPLAAVLAANAIAGYLWSRAIGLPGVEDHVGHWRDAFGTASLVFEAALIAVSVPALRSRVAHVAGGSALLATGLVSGGLLLGAAGGHAHGGATITRA